LLTLSGYPSYPLGVPSGGQEHITKATSFVEQWHADLLAEITQLLSESWTIRPFSIPVESSTMDPFYTKDPGFKTALTRQFFDILPAILRAIETNSDLFELYRMYGATFIHTLVRRFQNDAVLLKGKDAHPKERWVYDFTGKYTKTEHEVSFPTRTMFRKRVRQAWGTSAIGNTGPTMLFAAIRPVSARRYAYTWKHTTPAAMHKKLERFKHLIGGDVTTFDQSQQLYQLDHVIDNITTFHPGLREYLKKMYRAPFLITDDREGKRGYKYIGDATRFGDYRNGIGNPSGFAPNDFTNKAIGVWLLLIVLIEADVIKRPFNLRAFLRGEHPSCATLNMGDDSILAFVNKRDADAARDYMSKDKHPYFGMAPEAGARFLGRAYIMTPQGVSSEPVLNSYLFNILSPETSWKKKRLPAMGYFLRQSFYASHPYFDIAHRTVNETFARHFGVALDDYIKRYPDPEPDLAPVNATEREFLIDPRIIHYKIDPNDLSLSLLQRFFISFSAEEVGRLIAPWMVGTPTKWEDILAEE